MCPSVKVIDVEVELNQIGNIYCEFVFEKSFDEMKIETYCTSAGCMQCSGELCKQSAVCSNAVCGAEWPMQECSLWHAAERCCKCLDIGLTAVLHAAHCSLCCRLQFPEINIVNGSDD